MKTLTCIAFLAEDPSGLCLTLGQVGCHGGTPMLWRIPADPVNRRPGTQHATPVPRRLARSTPASAAWGAGQFCGEIQGVTGAAENQPGAGRPGGVPAPRENPSGLFRSDTLWCGVARGE